MFGLQDRTLQKTSAEPAILFRLPTQHGQLLTPASRGLMSNVATIALGIHCYKTHTCTCSGPEGLDAKMKTAAR